MDEFLEEFGRPEGQRPEAFGAPPSVSDGAEENGGNLTSDWLTDTPLDRKLANALCVVPDAVRAVVMEAARQWRVGPGVMLGASLHLLAAALGTSHRLRRGHLGYSAPFSILTCSPHLGRENWLECLAEPWLGTVRIHLREQQQFGYDHCLAELRGYQSAASSGAPSAFARPGERMVNAKMILQPCRIERSPFPAAMLKALPHSYERCVLGLNGGTNPVGELLASGRKPTLELCRLLEMSWQDMDLPSGTIIPKRGVIHLFWRSDVAQVRKLVWGRQSHWRTSPPPVLLMRHETEPTFLTPLDDKIFGAWAGLLKSRANDWRSKEEPIVWAMSSEADALAASFSREIMRAGTLEVQLESAQFGWFHQLVVRLALLLAALGRHATQKNAALEPIISEDLMNRARLIGWWMAHEHYDCLERLRTPQPMGVEHDIDDLDCIDDIDTEAVQSAILERLAANGPLSPRELSRSFHKLPRRDRDKVLSRLLKRGLIVETADQRLSLA